ncbi:MAG: adenosylcobalamin-dependent ribonucleoside-diphosphate reductase [Cyclobacteriaceae bacterium]
MPTQDEKALDKKTYSYDDVLSTSLDYFSGDTLAATTWINKYCLRTGDGKYLESTPDDMHHRMAKAFYEAESSYTPTSNKYQLSTHGQIRKPLSEEVIYRLFKNFKYVIPQGSVMAMLGNSESVSSLSNCVVIKAPIDSYGGILYTDQQLAQLCKRRCGVGFDISTLRPQGTPVKNAAGSSSGVVSFMERFSNTTREVSQNGRRGALMLTMDVSHPDIESFITAKQDLTKVTGANISVRISNAFMEAVQKDADFTLQWPINTQKPSVTKTVKAADLWKLIIQSAHKTAEPGIIFWDHQHEYSTSSVYPGFENESTNPCSEIAMQGNDSCRLMAINLFSFVNQPFTSEASFDTEKFYQVTYEAQRLMDDLVDLELRAIDKILQKIDSDPEPDEVKVTEKKTWELLKENGSKGRRTGLGFTGLADAIAALGLKFDSKQAIQKIDQIMLVKCQAEFDSSVDMAIERGAFEGFDPKIEQTSKFVEHLQTALPETCERMMEHGRRNISISTVAPTGTVSMMAQTSSGIEPVFMLSYKRKRKLADAKVTKNQKNIVKDDLGDLWEEFDVFHPRLKQWMELYPDKSIEQSPYADATANEIDWTKRIEIQSVIQKYVTHSISSTINLPEDATVDLVNKIYLQAWKKGLKGITVYRAGSRSGVLVSKDDQTKTQLTDKPAPERPEEIKARVVRFQNEHENWMAFVGLLDEKPYEIFTGRAEDAFALPTWVSEGWIIKHKESNKRSRYDFRYVDRQGYNVTIEGLSRSFDKEYWNYAKLISGILRYGMPISEVVRLIDHLNLDQDYINTWKNGVNRALKTFIPDGTVSKDHLCPSCNDEDGLIYEEGCLKCKSCGHTTCS